MYLHITGDVTENVLLTSADVAYLGRRREAHILNYMYKNKEKEELLDIKDVNTRSRAAPLFKTVKPSCEKYKNSALYHGTILLNLLPVNIRNIDSFDSFKAHQKKAMKENGQNFIGMLCYVYYRECLIFTSPVLDVLYVICSVSYILYRN